VVWRSRKLLTEGKVWVIHKKWETTTVSRTVRARRGGGKQLGPWEGSKKEDTLKGNGGYEVERRPCVFEKIEVKEIGEGGRQNMME